MSNIKRGSVRLDSDTFAKVKLLSQTTGIAINILITHIVNDGLARIDAGGGFVISAKDGSIKYNQAPIITPLPRKPDPIKIDPVTGAEYREVNFSGM